MIELATGVAFLMSSLYGAGQAQAQVTNTPVSGTAAGAGSVTISEARFTDSKNIEAYIRKQYADEPILVEIARCESTFRQYDETGNVIRGRVNKGDVGVMQINEKYHSDEAVKLGLNIYTVQGNVAFAKYLYDKYGAQPWSASSGCWSSGNDIAHR